MEEGKKKKKKQTTKNKQKKTHLVHFMNSERDIQVKRLNPTSVMNPDNRSLHIGFFRLMFMGFGIKSVNLKRKSQKICLEEIQSGFVV